MPSAALYASALPCSDLERAKRFYADKDSEGNLLAIVQLPVGAVDRPDT